MMAYFAVLLAALFFALLTLAHIVRIFNPFKIVIGSFTLPHWASYIFAIVGAYITYYLFLFL